MTAALSVQLPCAGVSDFLGHIFLDGKEPEKKMGQVRHCKIQSEVFEAIMGGCQ